MKWEDQGFSLSVVARRAVDIVVGSSTPTDMFVAYGMYPRSFDGHHVYVACPGRADGWLTAMALCDHHSWPTENEPTAVSAAHGPPPKMKNGRPFPTVVGRTLPSGALWACSRRPQQPVADDLFQSSRSYSATGCRLGVQSEAGLLVASATF